MHHSDRGVQYCSEAYTALLQKHHVQISMTQSGSPYDNAQAALTGFLKQNSGWTKSLQTSKVLGKKWRRVCRCITKKDPMPPIIT